MAGRAPSDLKYHLINDIKPLEINGEEYKAIQLEISSPSPQSRDKFVFLGDGKFTFSTAFAAHRKSWQGVVPTEYFPSDSGTHAPSDKQEQMKEALQRHIADQKSTFEKFINPRQEESSPELLNAWIKDATAHFPISNLDATYLGYREELTGRLKIEENSVITLWFQCPWDSITEEFIRRIFVSAACILKEGEYLLIGICIDEYWAAYGKLQENSNQFYDCIGADTSLVGKMLRLGYNHIFCNGNSSGYKNNEQFATLLFKRNSFSNRVPILGGLYLMLLETKDVGFWRCTDTSQETLIVREFKREQWNALRNKITEFCDHPEKFPEEQTLMEIQMNVRFVWFNSKDSQDQTIGLCGNSSKWWHGISFTSSQWRSWTASEKYLDVDKLFDQAEQ